MVDLGGYVIILVETHDKKVKLYGKKTEKKQISSKITFIINGICT